MNFADIYQEFIDTLLSLTPAMLMILLFQIFILRMPLLDFLPIVFGLLLTVLGFVFFIQGAKLGLLPIGQRIGTTFVERRAFKTFLLFGFLLGIVLTVAEPGVRLLVFQLEEAQLLTSGRNALILYVAIGLGLFSVLALLRIGLNIPIQRILLPGYLLALLVSLFSAEEILVQAYDMGSVTTGPITVPSLMALGVGMAAVLGGRDRLETGFGLMAISSIGPVLAVLLWGFLRGTP